MSAAQKALLGADPEVFVSKNDTLECVPIFGLVGGTKEKPSPFHWLGSAAESRYADFRYQEDGAALEFNVPPTGSFERFVSNVEFAVSGINGELLVKQGLHISNRVALQLTSEQLKHQNAQSIGCSPDHYAYDPKLPNFLRQPFEAKDLGNTRYAGGHLHLSYNKDAMPENVAAQFMDLHVGLRCVAMDKQGGRRKFYGLPGLYRPKPYGIEYRTLSNFWLFLERGKQHVLAISALRFAQSTFEPHIVEEVYKKYYGTIPWNDVHAAIANEDVKMAKMLVAWMSESNPEFSGIDLL